MYNLWIRSLKKTIDQPEIIKNKMRRYQEQSYQKFLENFNTVASLSTFQEASIQTY